MTTLQSSSTDSSAADCPPGAGEEFGRLLKAALEGCADSRNQMLHSIQAYLMFIARREWDDRLQAKIGPSDIVQSVLMHAEQNLDQFRGDDQKTLLAWTKTILQNQIRSKRRDFLQTEKRRAQREIRRQDSRCEIQLADTQHSPRTEAILTEESMLLRHAMKRLSGEYRRVIVLRNWDRMPFDEIGIAMDRSGDAAKKLWMRAIVQLKRELRRSSGAISSGS